MTEIRKPKPQPEMMTQEDPTVEAYIEQLEQNNKDLQEEFYKQGAKIDELKKENARLEESFQKATGEIAADPLPGECRNKAKPIDDFICSQCGINLVDLAFVEKEKYEDGYKDEVRYVYEPKFCPECGRKVKKEEDNNA